MGMSRMTAFERILGPHAVLNEFDQHVFQHAVSQYYPHNQGIAILAIIQLTTHCQMLS